LSKIDKKPLKMAITTLFQDIFLQQKLDDPKK
jgi:hypothetical protein